MIKLFKTHVSEYPNHKEYNLINCALISHINVLERADKKYHITFVLTDNSLHQTEMLSEDEYKKVMGHFEEVI